MTDALERIKNRQRPEVPKRDPGLTSTTSQNIDTLISRYPDIQISTLDDNSPTVQATDTSVLVGDLALDRSDSHSDIQISTLPDRVATPVKQTTLRLEKAVSDDLQALCNQEQICREVLIEAMFIELLNAPELRERIIDRATERQRKRTAEANHKRAVSMMHRVQS
jgi:hypothetical protein